MFKCQVCGTNSNNGDRQFKKTVISRQKFYTNKVRKDNDDGTYTILEKDSEGHEIVKEVNCCEKCK